MKISASYWMFEGGLEAKRPIAEAMQEAKDLGFDAIELAVGSQGVLTHNTTQAQCEDIVADAKKIGIEISSVASGPADSDATRAKGIARSPSPTTLTLRTSRR